MEKFRDYARLFRAYLIIISRIAKAFWVLRNDPIKACAIHVSESKLRRAITHDRGKKSVWLGIELKYEF